MISADTDSCSASAAAAGEPLAGTAPLAKVWLVIEQAGPFGHDAMRQSHFPKDVAAELMGRLDGTGIRPALIRRVGRHADTHAVTQVRRVYLAASEAGESKLAVATIEDPAALLDIDISTLAAGHVDASWTIAEPTADPLLLVCTHAKRDVCCAVHGRPIAQSLVANPQWSDLVWETSHLGGHRFAPTALQLPHGWVHGRLSIADAEGILRAARSPIPTVSVGTARGRSSLSARAQAADICVRLARGIVGIDDTRVAHLGGDIYEVSASTGTVRRVSVTTVDLDHGRRESCGKPSVVGHVFKTTIL